MHSNDKVQAHLTGILYLLLAILGGAAFFTISETLYVSGDASATFRNLTENAHSFRLSVTAWLVTMVFDVFVAWLLFNLFSKSAPKLAAISIIFRLVYVTIHAAALIHLFGIVSLLDAPSTDQFAGEALNMIEMHSNGFMIALLFFGIHLVLMGGLIINTSRLPRIIGIGLIIAGTAYIADTIALSMLPTETASVDALNVFVTIAATLGEVSFLFWLLFFGVRAANQEHTDLVSTGPGDIITN